MQSEWSSVPRSQWILVAFAAGIACGSGAHGTTVPANGSAAAASSSAGSHLDDGHPHLPLALDAEVELPGRATRFDYQDIDLKQGHLVTAHMNDAAVLITNLRDGSLAARLTNIPVARGVSVASDIGVIFVTSSPNTLVLIDSTSLKELRRVSTGNGPDGVAWDPEHQIVGISDQGDGALSLISDAGTGLRKQLKLGTETGNVVFDPTRGWFWITVIPRHKPDQLVGVDPVAASIQTSIALPGCSGAHGLCLHPNGKSAFVACESNDLLARVELEADHRIANAPTGSGPDVLAIDPGLGWLYVAAESGELTVFDINQPGATQIGRDRLGDNAHSIAVDAATHRVFFPIKHGPHGRPVLRIMHPSGT